MEAKNPAEKNRTRIYTNSFPSAHHYSIVLLTDTFFYRPQGRKVKRSRSKACIPTLSSS